MFAETSPIDKVDRRLVARLSDQIVGFVDINENHVRNLFVDPSQQGNKIGTQLIRKVEELVEGVEKTVMAQHFDAIVLGAGGESSAEGGFPAVGNWRTRRVWVVPLPTIFPKLDSAYCCWNSLNWIINKAVPTASRG